MRSVVSVVSVAAVSLLLSACVSDSGAKKVAPAAKTAVAFEQPEAASIIQKDLLGAPKTFDMPAGCITEDKEAIARGAYIFHNLNGKKAKAKAPKGLAKFVEKNGKKKPKQYGNCVACHNIEGAKGAGNIGPDLTGYKAVFMDTGVRDNAFVFQKIADPRVDNPNTHMTVNLTTKLFTTQEICEIASYIVAPK